MSPRRPALAATAFVLLLVAGAFAALSPRVGRDDAALLESTSTSPAIDSAIDAGASQAKGTLLPTSEPYQRIDALATAMKAGVPNPPPTLSVTQLQLVTATALGASQAAAATDPSTTLSNAQRNALDAIATGWLAGALAQMPASPDQHAQDALQAITKGVFAGAIQE